MKSIAPEAVVPMVATEQSIKFHSEMARKGTYSAQMASVPLPNPRREHSGTFALSVQSHQPEKLQGHARITRVPRLL